MVDLSEPVRSILDLVRRQTGKDFRFIEKNDLQGYHASVKMARKGMPDHVIYYRGEYSDIIDHIIAHECGHILRLFSAAPDKRKMVRTNQVTRAMAMIEIGDEVRQVLDQIEITDTSKIVEMWYNGIVRQVSSQPPDVMIEKWLYEDYPALRPSQALSLKKQMRESLQALPESVRRLMPGKIYDASCTMNCAFFELLSEYTSLPLYAPFRSTTFRARGHELCTLTRDNYVNSSEGDMAMIDRWAEFLHLMGWYEWADFEAIPADYANQF